MVSKAVYRRGGSRNENQILTIEVKFDIGSQRSQNEMCEVIDL